MADSFELVVIGAGPAGMSAATRARSLGIDVAVFDRARAPGGQIWRGIEQVSASGRAEALGEEYVEGARLASAFRASGATYLPDTTVWQVEPGFRVYLRRAGEVRIVTARALLIATGAFERPVPFPGWTLPGVITIGAAQILLKTAGQVPQAPVWVAGNGPLLLLYLNQLLDAGGQIAGILDTRGPGSRRSALAHLGGAFGAAREVLKGLRWSARLRAVPTIRRVSEIEAQGHDRVERVLYRTASGEQGSVATPLLLVHEGLVPDIHFSQALGCRHAWHDAQACFVPVLDEFGETSVPGVYVAGDAGPIGGARAACAAGAVAVLGIARTLGRLTADRAARDVAPARAALTQSLALRPLLDTVYRPRAQGSMPADDTIVCRCESVTAGALRAAVREGAREPNHVKAQTRCGMGACLGRQCGTVAAHVLAAALDRPVESIGLTRVRPPLAPITLAELAALAKVRT